MGFTHYQNLINLHQLIGRRRFRFTHLSNLVSEWGGTNRVWLMPGEPVRESATAVSPP
jgi:hypothetical protein